MKLRGGALNVLFILIPLTIGTARAQGSLSTEATAALLSAYPDFLDRVEGNDLVWKDGTRMRIDDGKGIKTFDSMLDHPDIKDMFIMKYPVGVKGFAPKVNFDPGRVRYTPLFEKMYGNCDNQGFSASLVDVAWLPGKTSTKLKFTRINGAADALQKVSNELANLPDHYLPYLRPSQGTYNCRRIAGTKRKSPHSFGIAIDIAAAHSHYWLRSNQSGTTVIAYRNEIPWEIVRVFEAHGFIWGGKWYHYDTMHFEYRPEIIPVAR
jgi:hypothetical protein